MDAFRSFQNLGSPMVEYVFPNLNTLSQRGGFEERSSELKKVNETLPCDDFALIEIPCDFVKNRTEVQRTGLDLCGPGVHTQPGTHDHDPPAHGRRARSGDLVGDGAPRRVRAAR